MSQIPLRRNRDFVLLESGRLLSSPVNAGIVSFARLTAHALFALVAGVAADRWNRRRLMIAADVVRGGR